jgi:short-subunit dehydrogenase
MAEEARAVVPASSRPCALVTGASGGIGLDLVRLLAADGHDVVLVARSAGRLEEIAAEVSGRFKVRCEVVPADLSRPEGIEAVMAALSQKGLEVEVLINNAGFGLFGHFATTELGKELEMIQLNIATLTALTKKVLPGMIQRRKGRILNVGSTGSFQPAPLMAVYGATKAYVLSFSEAIANELAGTGVTVTALCPGPTETGFVAAAKMGPSRMFKGPAVMSSPEVARIGYRALMAGRRVMVPGMFNKIGAFFAQIGPRGMVASIARYLMDRAE